MVKSKSAPSRNGRSKSSPSVNVAPPNAARAARALQTISNRDKKQEKSKLSQVPAARRPRGNQDNDETEDDPQKQAVSNPGQRSKSTKQRVLSLRRSSRLAHRNDEARDTMVLDPVPQLRRIPRKIEGSKDAPSTLNNRSQRRSSRAHNTHQDSLAQLSAPLDQEARSDAVELGVTAKRKARIISKETPSNRPKGRRRITDSPKKSRFSLPYGSVESLELVSEIAPFDIRNIGRVLEVPEYVGEIYHFLYEIEERHSAKPYTEFHQFLNGLDRDDMVDLLVRVSFRWDIDPTALHLAVQVVDRFLSNEILGSEDVLPVAVVALVIASKYEEITALTIAEIHENLVRNWRIPCTKKELETIERQILESLDYRISGPTYVSFLKRFLTIVEAPKKVKDLANYFTESALYVEPLLEYRPSAVAATMVCLALQNPDIKRDDAATQQRKILEYTCFNLSHLLEIAEIFERNFPGPPKSTAMALEGFLRHTPGVNDDTMGCAVWIKYGSKHCVHASGRPTRRSDPKADHLAIAENV